MSQYLNDDWSLEDELGIAFIGEHLGKIILGADTPFTVGVTGKWGSGKTSVLRRAFVTLGGKPLQQALPLGENRSESEKGRPSWDKYTHENEDKKAQLTALGWDTDDFKRAKQSLCVWYSPWQHQETDNPLIPLLLEIRAQFKARANWKDKAKELNRRGGFAGLAILEKLCSVASNLALGHDYVKDMKEMSVAAKNAWQGDEADLLQLSDGQRFHILFEEAVEILLASLTEKSADENTDSRLIIFIDDLDRCVDHVVVNMLESIKLYLNSHRCVFVLGIDDTAVLKSLENQWSKRSEDDHREYLEKLFQATIAVPLPRQKNIDELIKKQLIKHEFRGDKVPALADKITQLLGSNPRKIKNFMNSLCAAWQVVKTHEIFNSAENEERELAYNMFVLIHYLRIYHRPVWRLLERQPWSLPLLKHVLSGSDTEPPRLPIDKTNDSVQFMLQEFFSRAFVHVLRDNSKDAENTSSYRRMKLDDVVKLFQERIDRKCSDDAFVVWYCATIPDLDNYDLPDWLLHLPDYPITPNNGA